MTKHKKITPLDPLYSPVLQKWIDGMKNRPDIPEFDEMLDNMFDTELSLSQHQFVKRKWKDDEEDAPEFD